MRSKLFILAPILLAACACAQQPKSYLTGKLLEMDSVPCGPYNKDVQNDSVDPVNPVAVQTEAVCPEYVLQAEQVTYRVVSRNAKHPAPLPLGESALFRLQNGKMLLRVPAFDSKEREYIIVSMTPREQNAGDASPVRLNHLQ